MNNSRMGWIAAATNVCNNPFTKISCPNCNHQYLNILIVPWGNSEEKVDVNLICENCKSRNVVTKNIE